MNRSSTEHIKLIDSMDSLPVMYVTNIQSEKIFCFISVNNMPPLDNTRTEYGDSMMGANLTAFLEKGQNDLKVEVLPSGYFKEEKEHDSTGKCNVSILGVLENNEQDELTSLTVTVNENKKATTETSKSYETKYQSPLTDPEGIEKDDFTVFHRNFYVKTIPTWVWTQATPFTDTPENMEKLRQAYLDLYKMWGDKNYQGLKSAWSLSNREKSLAEGGFISPDYYFESIGFSNVWEMADDVQMRKMFPWEDYSLELYAGGRLVRLENEVGLSPLAISSLELDLSQSVNPYFSLIDGKIVLTR